MSDDRLAKELRGRGLIPLPRLWIHAEDYPVIEALAKKTAKIVHDARYRLREHRENTPQ